MAPRIRIHKHHGYPTSQNAIFRKCGEPEGPAKTMDEGWNLAFRIHNLTRWLKDHEGLMPHSINLRRFSKWFEASPPAIRDVIKVMMRLHEEG